MQRLFQRLTVLLALGSASILVAAEAVPTPPEGSAVEVREGDSWSKATFIRKEGRRLLICYSDNTDEWISSDRMRAGSDSGGKAPVGKPPAPAPTDTPAADIAGEAITLDGPFTEIVLDTAPEPRRIAATAAKQTPTTRPADGFGHLTFGGAPLPEIDKFVTCADSSNILIGVAHKPFSEQTHIVRIDLDHPGQAEERLFTAPQLEVLSAADGGKLLLTKPQSDAVVLHLWEYSGDEYKLKANYTFTSRKGGRRIASATMVTPTRALVCVDRDENFLVDLNSRRAICFFKYSGNRVQFDPTGRLVLLHNNGSGGVLRATAGSPPNCRAVTRSRFPASTRPGRSQRMPPRMVCGSPSLPQAQR